MNTELRVIGPEDWVAFRDVRLQALADSPDAFGTTLAEAAEHPPTVWRSRAAGPGPIVVAFDAGASVAMGGLFVPEAFADAFVWGMWVRPLSRGLGLAARILQQLLEEAEDLGRPVVLHVTQGNAAARRLYERYGFVATGEVQPLRENSPVLIDTMRRA